MIFQCRYVYQYLSLVCETENDVLFMGFRFMLYIIY